MREHAEKPRREPTRKPPSSGNRRNPHTHRAILTATLQLLETVHYPDLTIESIASAAKVGKATVYRWWPSKGALVAEAISSVLSVERPPDSEDLHADLVAAAEISIRNYAQPPAGILIVALAADLASDPELLQSFAGTFVQPRRAAVRGLLQRAVDEGVIPANLDPELIMDMWAGAVMYRRVMQHAPIDSAFAAELVSAVAADPSETLSRAGLLAAPHPQANR